MNRIFHARVPWYTILFLILLAGITIWSYWERLGLVALISLLWMVVLIERTIHTTYTVTTDGTLVIHRGRFSKDIIVPLTDIRCIELIRSARIGTVCMKRYLLVHYGEDHTLSLIPMKEQEMVMYIKEKRK